MKIKIIGFFVFAFIISFSGQLIAAQADSLTIELRPVKTESADGFSKMNYIDPNFASKDFYVSSEAILSLKDIEKLEAYADQYSGKYGLEIIFDEEGKEEFEKYTRENIGSLLGIVVNGQLITSPVIRAVISGGKVQTGGVFHKNEAKDILKKFSQIKDAQKVKA